MVESVAIGGADESVAAGATDVSTSGGGDDASVAAVGPENRQLCTSLCLHHFMWPLPRTSQPSTRSFSLFEYPGNEETSGGVI